MTFVLNMPLVLLAYKADMLYRMKAQIFQDVESSLVPMPGSTDRLLECGIITIVVTITTLSCMLMMSQVCAG